MCEESQTPPAPADWAPDAAFLRVQQAGVDVGIVSTDVALLNAFAEAVHALGEARGAAAGVPNHDALVMRVKNADGAETVTVIPHPGANEHA